ncbi:MAG TPA: HD domain-containing protein [Saprospiraceae bacterium]|nr:HD domain-containing protein [Saprospiraceae bacterium]
MSKIKIFNDPIYGFIMVPDGILMKLIDHPWFQRLRRIKQLGLSHFVYPGAVHTRFHHALGAFHLMTKALDILRFKGQDIRQEEYEAAQIAALLHDIGHGPFSHVLEHSLVPLDHEILTGWIMDALNREFDGRLDLAIEIFSGRYPRRFLCELVASQLDVDRMDYLNRDSFYSGVVEGTIGCDRILNMMDIADDRLVVEEKSALSIENYLGARRLMYWQVYMHKTSLIAEHMLQQLLIQVKQREGSGLDSGRLGYFMQWPGSFDPFANTGELLHHYQSIDDSDIEQLLKACRDASHPLIAFLANGLLSRKFLKIAIQEQPPDEETLRYYRDQTQLLLHFDPVETAQLISTNVLEFSGYSTQDDEVLIRTKTNAIRKLSEIVQLSHFTRHEMKYYLAYPKEIPPRYPEP